MPRFQHAIAISAPPGRVWGILVDVERWPVRVTASQWPSAVVDHHHTVDPVEPVDHQQ